MEFEALPPSPCPACGGDMFVRTSPMLEGLTESPVSHWRCGCGLVLPSIGGRPSPVQIDAQGHIHLPNGATRCRCSGGSPGFAISETDPRPSYECTACSFPLSLAALLAHGDQQRAQGLKGNPFDPWGESPASRAANDPAAQARRAEREAMEAASSHVCPVCKTRKLIRRESTKMPGRFWWGCAGFPKCSASFFDDAGAPGKRMTKK